LALPEKARMTKGQSMKPLQISTFISCQRCNIEAKRILSEHQVEPKPDEVLKAIDEILRRG